MSQRLKERTTPPHTGARRQPPESLPGGLGTAHLGEPQAGRNPASVLGAGRKSCARAAAARAQGCGGQGRPPGRAGAPPLAPQSWRPSSRAASGSRAAALTCPALRRCRHRHRRGFLLRVRTQQSRLPRRPRSGAPIPASLSHLPPVPHGTTPARHPLPWPAPPQPPHRPTEHARAPPAVPARARALPPDQASQQPRPASEARRPIPGPRRPRRPGGLRHRESPFLLFLLRSAFGTVCTCSGLRGLLPRQPVPRLLTGLLSRVFSRAPRSFCDWELTPAPDAPCPPLVLVTVPLGWGLEATQRPHSQPQSLHSEWSFKWKSSTF